MKQEGAHKANKTEYGAFSLLELHGSWREMGRQYGSLMRKELSAIYAQVLSGPYLSDVGFEGSRLKRAADSLFMLYPHRFKEFFRGAAETSGLDLPSHLILNALEWIGAEAVARPHCSVVAAWGEYTDRKPLVLGRNFDYLPEFRKYSKYLTVTAFNPSDGSRPVATIGYAGSLYATTAMNADGLMVALNGSPSGGAIWYEHRVPSMALLLEFLLDCTLLEELDGRFQSFRVNFPIIVAVADERRAWTYECPVFDVRRRKAIRQGLLVATNHFTDPDWGLPDPDDDYFWFTRTRRSNLLALGENFRGNINPVRMREILDTTIADYGATWENTIFQVVSVPKDRTIWLKAPDVQDWTHIELAHALGCA